MSMGSRIKQARLLKGLSRTELAGLLEITPSAISNYENGISSPRPDRLMAIIKELGVDANYLYQDEVSDMNPEAPMPTISDYLKKYRALDERGRETVDGVLDIEYSRAVDAAKKGST